MTVTTESRFPQMWRLQSPLLTGRVCIRCLMHICIRVKRGWAEVHSRKNSLISQPRFLWSTAWKRTRRFPGAWTWCWVLSGYVRVCDLCEGSGVNHHEDCAVLATAQLQSKVSTNAHTHQHTHQHGSPYFVSVKQVYLNRLRRISKHYSGSPSLHCQATGLHPSLPPPVFLTKCHFTFPSRRKFKAAHRDNLRIMTLRMHRQHFLLPLSFSLPRTSSAPAFAPAPPPSRTHLFPPLTSSSLLLLPACQDDFKLVASGLT